MKKVYVGLLTVVASGITASDEEGRQRSHSQPETSSIFSSCSRASHPEQVTDKKEPVEKAELEPKKPNPFEKPSPLMRRKSSTSVHYLRPSINTIPEDEVVDE